MERTDETPTFAPDEGLEGSGGVTTRDTAPVSRLDLTSDLLPEPDDTATDGVPLPDHTMPIPQGALQALLAEEPDLERTGDVIDELSADFEVGESTEVDLGAAAHAVAAELMGPAGTPSFGGHRPTPPRPKRAPPPPPDPSVALETPPAPVRPPLPADRRPIPRAPSLSMLPSEPPVPAPAVQLPPPSMDPTEALVAPTARPLAEPPPPRRAWGRPALLLGLAATPFVVFLVWWWGL